MNNSELERKLKDARGPVLDAEYQAAFAPQVLANLRSSGTTMTRPRRLRWPRLAWALATAACVVVAFLAGRWLGPSAASLDVLADSKLIRETLAMFPNRVRAIVRDQRGINLVLSDKDDVPTSTPIYVRICVGKNCQSMVTFSGQEIQIAGQKLTVLSEADGGIILEGKEFVWESTQRNLATGRLKIEARNLGPANM
jgi:hypothetical protein